MVMNPTSSVLREDPAPVSPSHRHRSRTSSQRERRGGSEADRGRCKSSMYPHGTESNRLGADSIQNLPQRTRSSSVHARRRSYHDNQFARNQAPLSVPPPQWFRGRQNGVSDFPGQLVEDPSKFAQPNCNPFQHQSIPYFDQPQKSEFEKRNQSLNARMQNTGPSQSNDGWCQKSDNPLGVWMDGYQMHGSNYNRGGSVINNRVGDGHNRTRSTKNSQNSKRFPQAVPGRNRKNAVTSPKQELYGGDLKQNSHTGKGSAARHHKRHSVGYDIREKQGHKLSDNHFDGRSRYDQFIFSADHPPPPFYSHISEPRPASSPGCFDNVELPRHIGDILKRRDQLVALGLNHRTCSPAFADFSEKKGNCTKSFRETLPDHHLDQKHNSKHMANHRDNGFQRTRVPNTTRNRSYTDIRRTSDNLTKVSNGNSESRGVNWECNTRSSSSEHFSKASVFSKNMDSRQEAWSHFQVRSKNDCPKTSFYQDARISVKDSSLTNLKDKSEFTQQHVTRFGLKNESQLTSPAFEVSEIGGVNFSQTVLDTKDTAAKLPGYFSKLAVNDTFSNGKTLAVQQSHEAQQDLAKAQELGLPIKIGPSQTGCSEENRATTSKFSLSPWAEEFDPNLRDGSGNAFTMIKQNGTCYFRPSASASHVPSDPRYVIQHDRQFTSNKPEDGNHLEVPIQPECYPDYNYQHMISRHNTQGCIELQPLDQRHQLQSDLQQQMYLPINHTHQGETNHVIYPSGHTHFQEQTQPNLFHNMGQVIDETYTPVVSTTNSMFAFPVPVPLGLGMANNTPQQIHAPYEMSQENDATRHGVNRGKSTSILFPTTQHNPMLVPSVPTFTEIPAARASQSNFGNEPNLVYTAQKPGICIPLHHFPNEINGAFQSPITNIQGHSPFLPDHSGRFTQITPAMLQACAPHGQMLYTPLTPTSEGFSPAVPLHNARKVDTNQTSQVETVGHVSESLKMNSVILTDGDGDNDGYRKPTSANNASLNDKIKDALMGVRESLRSQASLDEENPADSEDDRRLNEELTGVLNKLFLIQQRGSIASLHNVLEKSPENYRQTIELMIKLLCIVSRQKSNLDTSDFRKIVRLHRTLTSSLSPSLLERLIKLLSTVESPTLCQDGSSNSLELIILKSVEAENKNATKNFPETDQVLLVNGSEKSASVNFGQCSILSNVESAKYPFTYDSDNSTSSEYLPKKFQDPTENSSPIQTSFGSHLAYSTATPMSTTETREASKDKTHISNIAPATRDRNQDLPTSGVHAIDESSFMATAPSGDVARELELVDRQADRHDARILAGTSGDTASPKATCVHSSLATSRPVLATPGVTADTKQDSEPVSRTSTPHPIPRHRTLNRVWARDIRSPAFDCVDIASRIGVFERMKSKC